MPYEIIPIPDDARCLNKNCNHIYGVHDNVDACDLCFCPEFKIPYSFKPKWIRDPDADIFRWVCKSCHQKLFGRHIVIGMTSRELQMCVKCLDDATCSMVNKELIV